MIVAGSKCTVFDDTGRTCTVTSFSESVRRLENMRIVDTVVAYDCPFKCKTYLLLMRNVLHIPELPLNLLRPLIMREAGILVDECPKLQSSNPSIKNHSMFMTEADVRIHFDLNGIFSSFETRKPTEVELEICDKIVITPDSASWDPYSDHFGQNETAMVDHNGELLTHGNHIQKELISDETNYSLLP